MMHLQSLHRSNLLIALACAGLLLTALPLGLWFF
jgi:hypothetical protein